MRCGLKRVECEYHGLTKVDGDRHYFVDAFDEVIKLLLAFR